MKTLIKTYWAEILGGLAAWAFLWLAYTSAMCAGDSCNMFPDEAAHVEPAPYLTTDDFVKWAQADLEWKQGAYAKAMEIQAGCNAATKRAKK